MKAAIQRTVDRPVPTTTRLILAIAAKPFVLVSFFILL